VLKHVAQINISRMRAQLEDEVMHGFAGRLDEINALADSSPGFVWRLQTDDGDATALRVFDDPLTLINLSVWSDIQSLRDFVFRSKHRELLLGREQWFLPMDGPRLALWWVEPNHHPDVDEAKTRLDQLANEGSSREVFTFATVPRD